MLFYGRTLGPAQTANNSTNKYTNRRTTISLNIGQKYYAKIIKSNKLWRKILYIE